LIIIVFLSEKLPCENVRNILGKFPKIIFIRGSPFKEKDLFRAKIRTASKAVIFGTSQSRKSRNAAEDTESLFIYKAIKKCHPGLQIIIEMMNPKNIQFLQTDSENQDPSQCLSDDDFRYELTSLYAAGEMYHSGIVDTLTCQAFYNPHLLTILQQILVGMKQRDYVEMALYDELGITQSNLILKAIPPDYIGVTFEKLFQHFAIEKNLICLGIYR
jgi:hypothetical protein